MYTKQATRKTHPSRKHLSKLGNIIHKYDYDYNKNLAQYGSSNGIHLH